MEEEPMVSLTEVTAENQEQVLDLFCGTALPPTFHIRSFRDFRAVTSIEVQPLPGPQDFEAKQKAQEKRERKAARRRELR